MNWRVINHKKIHSNIYLLYCLSAIYSFLSLESKKVYRNYVSIPSKKKKKISEFHAHLLGNFFLDRTS